MRRKIGKDPGRLQIQRTHSNSVFKIVVVLLLICIAVVAVVMWGRVHFDDDTVLERELNKIARDYYENYYYDKKMQQFKVGEGGADAAAVLSDYAEVGIPEVLLRQLLLFDNSRWKDSRELFEQLGCDTNKTSVRFFPTEPYGVKDYTMTVSYACEKQ